MQTLRREFSDESIQCDSKIELPWKDIALPTTGMRIRPDTTLVPIIDRETDEIDIETVKTEKKESTVMTLPWQDLLITETLQSIQNDATTETCDSSLEIPWSDLVLEKPITIRPPIEEKTCVSDDVEIPWNEILVPRNIIIRPEKKRKHPSSEQSPRARDADTTCVCDINPCSTKTRADIKFLLGPLLACRLCVRYLLVNYY